jgi:hypothetical protein
MTARSTPPVGISKFHVHEEEAPARRASPSGRIRLFEDLAKLPNQPKGPLGLLAGRVDEHLEASLVDLEHAAKELTGLNLRPRGRARVHGNGWAAGLKRCGRLRYRGPAGVSGCCGDHGSGVFYTAEVNFLTR